MTTQPTTTKEALEPCPFCGATPIRRDNVYRYGSIAEHPEGTHCPIENTTIGVNSWNLRTPAPIVAPEVDDEQVTPTMVIEALRMMVQLWDDNHSDDPCGCVGASDDCKFPPPCELCCAREALRSFAIERPRQVFDVGFAAPASTVAPQQSQCLHQCDYGGMPRCSLPAGHEGTHDYTNAPASPAAPISSEAWTEWFNRLGAKASAEVVNATADLVTNERLAALVQAKVLPDPAALRDEAQVERHDILGALNHSRTICLHNAQDQSKSSEYRLMMEHFAEAGRQIIEMITEGRHKNLSRLVLE